METVDSKTKTCIVCGQDKEEGITIMTEFICASCEAEMVETETDDAKYPYFVRRLRQLWIRPQV